MRCLIGSQCNFLSIGVMCSNFDVFVTTRVETSFNYTIIYYSTVYNIACCLFVGPYWPVVYKLLE